MSGPQPTNKMKKKKIENNFCIDKKKITQTAKSTLCEETNKMKSYKWLP